MTRPEIVRLIKTYIGVTYDGHLVDFTLNSLADFYPLFCELDINSHEYTGTKRERFETIISSSAPDVQAKIIRGTLKKCPPSSDRPSRSQQLHDDFLQLARRLEGIAPVAAPAPKVTSAVVDRALGDIESMIGRGEPTSCVDRVHTLLHGYLQTACRDASIAFEPESLLNVLFNRLKAEHPAFSRPGPRADDITHILRMMGSVVDKLNPIRNNASMAHPKELLERPEAMLVVNAARTVLHYIDAKVSA